MRAYAAEAVKQALAQSHPTTTQPTGSLNLPDLSPVITWMENGCSDIEAIKELRLYQKQIDAAKQPLAQPARHPEDAFNDSAVDNLADAMKKKL